MPNISFAANVGNAGCDRSIQNTRKMSAQGREAQSEIG